MRASLGILIAAVGASFAPTSSVGAEIRQVRGLAALAHGQWELRSRSGPIERICIRDPRQLIQLRHPRQACDSIVVEDEARDVTVQYTCRGRGYGRTHIRRETNRLAQLDSQGIVDGSPFNFEAELRWVGPRCSG